MVIGKPDASQDLRSSRRISVNRRRSAFRLWQIAVYLCAITPASAQYSFDVWTADDGLPQNIITGIRQTSDGYLWLATFDGLARFDGVRFTVFDKSNSPGIASNRFESLFEDRSGDLWLGTEGSGVTRYHQGGFTTYTTQQGLPNNEVRAFTDDEAGNLWVLSGDSIAQWQKATGQFADVTPKESKIPYKPLLWEDGFWGTDQAGLHCFVKGRFVTYQLPLSLSGSKITEVAEDQSGTIWLETADGHHASIRNDVVESPKAETSGLEMTIAYRDHRGNSWTIGVGHDLTRRMNQSAAVKPEKIAFYSLYEDQEGNLWLGTDGRGLYRVRRNAITAYSKEQGLIDKNVYPIYQDRTGAIWIGAWPEGLSQFKEGKFTNYTLRDGLPSHLTALTEDREGHLWVGGQGEIRTFQYGAFVESPGSGLPEVKETHAIHQGPDGTLWFGSPRGLVRFKDRLSTLYTTKDGLAGDDTRVIIDGSVGNLWIGGYGGLTRFRNGQFTSWTARDGLPSNTVRSLYEDRDGVLWIGTYDGGLGRFKDGKFTRYTMHEGLFDNGVFQILEDSRDNLWISCNRGIYRVSKRELNKFAAGELTSITSVAYGRSDGMLNVECNGGIWPAGIKARDGKLWFPTQDGVAVIDPEAVPSNPRPPPVIIESVLLNHARSAADRPLRIAPDKKNFEIEYTALSFINSQRIRFKYKLEGLDSGWIDAGQRRTAYYSLVPPGRYVFKVTAANSDGVWNDTGKSLEITVLAPFYRTSWFQLVAFLGVVALAGTASRYRFRQLQRGQAVQQAFSQQLIASQENERKRIAAELHDTLGQRLVIIKNLALFFLRSQEDTSIKNGKLGLIEEIANEAGLAADESREISYDLRPFQLDRLGLSKAIEGVIRTASSASGTRFSSELDNIDDVFPEALRINFYRIVQECLNNIIKHAQATEASISVKRTVDRVVTLTVRDNGTGFTPGNSSCEELGRGGFGLTGMSERARLLGGELAVQTVPDRGTVVSLVIRPGSKGHG